MKKIKGVKPRLAKLVKSFRKSRKISQKQFAYLAGVNESTVSRWERRLCEPTKMEVVYRLSRALGMPMDELADKVWPSPKK